jgi:hypothetical protein
MQMRRVAIILGSAIAMTTTSIHAEQTTIVSSSQNGRNHATVTQTGSEPGKSKVEVRSGPGYVIIQQSGSNNRTEIFQRAQ